MINPNSYFTTAFSVLSVVHLSACSISNMDSKEVSKTNIKKPEIKLVKNKELKSLDINKVYRSFTPVQSEFKSIFKVKLPNASYKKYILNINKKIEYIANSVRDKPFIGSRVIYKDSVSSRYKLSDNEWTWTNRKKVKKYYRSFKHPADIFEYKVAYQIKANPSIKSKKAAKQKDEVTTKNIPTDRNIIFYFYRQKNNPKFYILDPDIVIKSML